VETLPLRWRKTSLTSPRPGANHIVRLPLPNGKPRWVSVDSIAIALRRPAGTRTFCIPSTRERPVTPNTSKSRLSRELSQVSPRSG
jgi:hypothetical protein